MKKCPMCEGTKWDHGNITLWDKRTGKLVYWSDRHKKLRAPCDVQTFACVNCGYIASFIDPKKLDIKTK